MDCYISESRGKTIVKMVRRDSVTCEECVGTPHYSRLAFLGPSESLARIGARKRFEQVRPVVGVDLAAQLFRSRLTVPADFFFEVRSVETKVTEAADFKRPIERDAAEVVFFSQSLSP